MALNTERKIGETFDFGDVKLNVAIDDYGCRCCYFCKSDIFCSNDNFDITGQCSYYLRNDRTNVIFKEV